MSVAFVRHDHPAEQRGFYKLVWRGRETLFTAASDAGFNRLQRENPTLGIVEVMRMMQALQQLELNIKLPKDLLNDLDFLMNIDTFIDVFAASVRGRLKHYRVTVIFDPYGVNRRFLRHVKYPPLLPPS